MQFCSSDTYLRSRISVNFYITYNSEIKQLKNLCVCLVAQLCPILCDPMNCSPPGLSAHGDSPGKHVGVDCHDLLQGIFPIQGSLQAGSLPSEPTREAQKIYITSQNPYLTLIFNFLNKALCKSIFLHQNALVAETKRFLLPAIDNFASGLFSPYLTSCGSNGSITC